MKNLVHAANATAWALGKQQGNGFYVRRVVWGLLLASEERRPDEEIRAAVIMLEPTHKKRKTKGMRRIWHPEQLAGNE